MSRWKAKLNVLHGSIEAPASDGETILAHSRHQKYLKPGVGVNALILILQMEDLPSLSSGSVGSRFVSQTDLEEAKQKREEQWKAAYAR